MKIEYSKFQTKAYQDTRISIGRHQDPSESSDARFVRIVQYFDIRI